MAISPFLSGTSAADTTDSDLTTAWQPNTVYPGEATVTNAGGFYQAPEGGVLARDMFIPSEWNHLADIADPSGTIPSGSTGPPTFAPTLVAGTVPTYLDTTGGVNELYAYLNGAWVPARAGKLAVASIQTADVPLAANTYTTPVDASSGLITMTLPAGC